MIKQVTLLAAAGLCSAAADIPQERAVTGDGITTIAIAGIKGRVRIEPAGTGLPIFDSAYGKTLGIRPSMLRIGFRVGPLKVQGRIALARIDTGYGPPDKRTRIVWLNPAYAPGVDGVFGPGSVPEPIVRFTLRPPVAGERTVSLPMSDMGHWADWDRIYADVPVGDQVVKILFDPRRPTIATARTGALIALAQDGVLEGPQQRTEIAFGMKRPIRRLRLAKPLVIGPLSIGKIFVRTTEAGSVSGVKDADADPDEVVVTAKSKKDKERDHLSIGSDQLDHCSSIVFDKPARQIRLTCA